MRRLRDESGQMMTALVIGLAVSLLAVIVVAIVPIGAATNEKTQSQTAADAAALAGAEEVRSLWVDGYGRPGVVEWRDPDKPGGRGFALGLKGTDGYDAADDYARRNGARIADYRVVPGRGRVFAKVENSYAAYTERGNAISDATAQMDVAFDDCSWSRRPPGLLTVEEAVAAGAPPEPFFLATLTCGGWSAQYQLYNSSSVFFKSKDWAPGWGRDRAYSLLEPRLVD